MKLRYLFLFVLIACLFVMPMAFASDAQISYTLVNTPVVYDIPFKLNVLTTTTDAAKAVPILEYGVTVTSDSGQALFLSHIKYDPATQNAKTGPLNANAKYRVFTDSSGNSWIPNPLLTLNVKFTGIPATGEKGSKIILDAKPEVGHFFTPATGQGTPFTSIMSTDSALITPVLSTCGDGVVGYVDVNKDGKYVPADGDVAEVCDTKLPGGEGCSDGCTYIKKEYRVKADVDINPATPPKTLGEHKSCVFGSYSCSLEALPARDLFLAKVGALLDGKCFPYNEHKDADYCEGGKPMLVLTPDGKVKSEDRVFVISRIGAALTDLFNSIISIIS